MNRVYLTIVIYLLVIFSYSYGQTHDYTKKDLELKALAKFLSFETHGKLKTSKYVIIKSFIETAFEGDTINVDHYFYKEDNNQFDTVFLTLEKFPGQTILKKHFICPNYDANIGIKKARVDFIDLESLEKEQGRVSKTFTRIENEVKWFLLIKCADPQASIKIAGIPTGSLTWLNKSNKGCPLYLELTNIPDGNYNARIFEACTINELRFNIVTLN